MTEIGEILIEEEIEEEKAPEYEAFLNAAQVEALQKAGFIDKVTVRRATDEELIKLNGIGPATIIKLRDWCIGEVAEGDAVSLRCLSLNANGEILDVNPGDIIPAKFGAARQVEKGKASWK